MKKIISIISALILSLPTFNTANAQQSWNIPNFPQSGNLKNGSITDGGRRVNTYQFVCYDIRNNPDVNTMANQPPITSTKQGKQTGALINLLFFWIF